MTTDTTNIGYKNPYRYRGYRYDSESGLYYLNSRYYSPEWGRFINADAIVGSIGELLGANVFAYCKNNVVNKYDSSGFMALDCEGRGRTAPSLVVEDNKRKNKSSSIIPSKSQLKDVERSSLVTGIEGGISSALSDVPDYLVIGGNRAARRAGQELIVPIRGAAAARGIGSVEKVGAVGVVLTGVTVWDDYHSGYSKQEARGRSKVDIGVSAGVIVVGILCPEAAIPAAITFGIAGEIYKKKHW